MMVGSQKHSLLFIVVATGLAALLAGCGSSTPGLGDAENAFEDEEYEEALASIDRALEHDSAAFRALLLRGKVLRKMADTSMAAKEYADFYRRAREAETRAVEISPAQKTTVEKRQERVFATQFQLGEDAYNVGSKNDDASAYRAAVDYFAAAGATRPDSARAFLNGAYARIRLGERATVIPVLERYREHADSVEREVYKILGQLYIGEGQDAAASKVLDEATSVFPDDDELHALRLKAYNRAGDVDRALEVYRNQIEQKPNNATYRYNYGALLIKAHRYSEAIMHLGRAVELQPEHAESQFNLGVAYMNAAVARDDSIRSLEGQDGDALSDRERSSQISTLVQRRDRFFRKAIPPLERARKMVDGRSRVRRDACRALLVAYVQTDRPNRAAQVEDCSEFTKPGP